ncbi:MAG: hypothetical protein J2P24_12370 [Streptosporangiales bacterium]|nr:hypothetical protein [Streptosporangiales bacterium]MBO0889511.1 hypothetical protein [Acidothermales bacterium]
MNRAVACLAGWWCRPAPASRIAWLRVLTYAFLWLDVFDFTGDVIAHGYGAAELYRPVLLARLLHVPAPNPVTVQVLRVAILAGAVVAAAGWRPRLSGTVVALAYTWWQLVNMSYGKVDHDHLAILAAVWVLPTAGVASSRDDSRGEAAGFALRCVQVAVTGTYFLSALAKLRMGGPDWPTGATFAWSIVRRGSWLAHPLLDVPHLLVAAQFGLLTAELLSPLLLVLRGRWRLALVLFWASFHLVTYLGIGIHFLPTAILLTAFLPLERVAAWVRRPVVREPGYGRSPATSSSGTPRTGNGSSAS